MNVDAWGLAEEDVGRSRRLAIGYLAGLAVIAALVGIAATVRASGPPKEEEEVLDVKLASTPSAAPAPPPPPPPPPPEPVKAAPPAPAARKAIIAPTAVPTEAPPESDKPVKPASGPDEYADGKGGKKGGVAGGDPNGVVGGVLGGTGTALPVPPPAPTPPPVPTGPVVVTEDMTPASPVSTPDPPVPDEARSQGISATVVVRFTITETGAVTDVAVVRGNHPLLDPVVIATVRTWRFKPALTADGRPVSSKKTKTFRYNFKQ